MNKQEFLDKLRARLSGLPREELDERLGFYSEIIDDRIEEGVEEDEAVLSLGSVDEVAEQIIADIPLSKIAKERIKPQRSFRVWEVVLLVLGSPVWLPLLIAAFVVVLSLYVVIWSVVASLWAVFGAIVGCGVGFAALGICLICFGDVFAGIAIIGAGIVCAGLSIFAFFGCKAATKGTAWLTKRMALWVKNCFIRKEEA